MTRTILLILLLLALGSARAAAQRYVVVVNTANSAASLSKSEAADLFLKKTTKWPDGRSAAPVDQAKSSAVRDAFSRAVLSRPVSAVGAYWQQMIFSGKDVPPPEKPGDAEVLAFIKANAGAIGYVSATADLTGVRKVTVE